MPRCLRTGSVNPLLAKLLGVLGAIRPGVPWDETANETLSRFVLPRHNQYTASQGESQGTFVHSIERRIHAKNRNCHAKVHAGILDIDSVLHL